MKYKGIDLSGLDMEISEDIAKEFIEHREINKKKLTQGAFNRAMKTALKAFQIGMTPDELIEFTIDKGWQGINLEWAKNALMKESHIQVNTRSLDTRGMSIQQEMSDDWAH